MPREAAKVGQRLDSKLETKLVLNSKTSHLIILCKGQSKYFQ